MNKNKRVWINLQMFLSKIIKIFILHGFYFAIQIKKKKEKKNK